jgi:hypothetical protein
VVFHADIESLINMPNTPKPTIAQSAALPCVYVLDTSPSSRKSNLRPLEYFDQMREQYSVAERVQDSNQYILQESESLALSPCKVFLAKPATKSFMSYVFRFGRGDPFVDIFVYGDAALVSDRAKRCIEALDDPACHQFYPSALLDKNRMPINDEPYWGWRPLRCVELPEAASHEETEKRIVRDSGYRDSGFLPVLENSVLFEKFSRIPFWRVAYSGSPFYLSQASLDGLTHAGLTGLNLHKRFSNAVSRGDPSVFKIDPMNLRVNFKGSEFEKRRNKEDAKQRAKTAKLIAEINLASST